MLLCLIVLNSVLIGLGICAELYPQFPLLVEIFYFLIIITRVSSQCINCLFIVKKKLESSQNIRWKLIFLTLDTIPLLLCSFWVYNLLSPNVVDYNLYKKSTSTVATVSTISQVVFILPISLFAVLRSIFFTILHNSL